MTLEELLSQLHDRNIKLWVEQDRLRYSAPKGALTDALLAALVYHKIEVMTFLKQAAQIVEPRADLPSSQLAAAETDLTTQQVVAGVCPLTARQITFFQTRANQIDPHNYFSNTISLFELTQPVDPALLRAALHQLLLHHDGLRLRLEHGAARWEARIAEPDDQVPFAVVDLTGADAADEQRRFDRATWQIINGLNISAGPMISMTLFERGPTKPSLLLLVVHHLVTDGFSNLVLLADFETVYHQLSKGLSARLPAKTASIKALNEAMLAYAQSPELLSEARYWLELPWSSVARLPTDLPVDPKLASQASTCIEAAALTRGQTHRLLQLLSGLSNTRLLDVVIASVVIALAQWTTQRTYLIELVDSVRTWTPTGLSLSRTVGWLTTHIPVVLSLGQAQPTWAMFELIRAQLHSMPHGGVGYELLRCHCADQSIRSQLETLPSPEISINFTGHQAQPLKASQVLRPSRIFKEPQRNVQNTRYMTIKLNTFIAEDQLHVQWGYSSQVYRAATIRRLADCGIDAIHALIRHGTSYLEHRDMTDPAGLSR